jgi:hypothetical protein
MLLILVNLFCLPCYAQEIASVSDTINGSSFGTKSTAQPIIWDDFELGSSGVLLGDEDSDWIPYGGRSGGLYDNQKSYSGSLSAYNFVSSSGDGRDEFDTN